MARHPRLNLAGVPQHVVQRGNNRRPTFFTEGDFRAYLDYLHEAAEAHGCDVHAFVLMTNHVHLLMTPLETDSISRAMQALGRRYVRYVNRARERSGTLWEGRYKATLVDGQRYFLACCRYIEMNPVRAGIVSNPAAYKWSSYRTHALGHVDPIVREHPEYTALGSSVSARASAYRALFVPDSDEVLGEIRNTLQRGWPLGSDNFKDGIESALARAVRPPKRGRPLSGEIQGLQAERRS